MQLNINDLKDLMSKISQAVEKSKINPKSGWIELIVEDSKLNFKVSNTDYYLEASIDILGTDIDTTFHVTVLAETFIPLISKLDDDIVTFSALPNALILTTATSSYTFPIIKELGRTKCVDTIAFNATSSSISIQAANLVSVADVNLKGFVDAVLAKNTYANYIYIDNIGAITITENIYVNTFPSAASSSFKMLLTPIQTKLLTIFKDEGDLILELEQLPTYNNEQTNTNKICIKNTKIKLILVTQPQNVVDTFPSIKARALADNDRQIHIELDRKALEKALTRLMIFDKKFDITVLDYSKLVFKTDSVELVSIKNKNYEKLPYISSTNAIEYEAMIRFVDLLRQLKAVTTKTLDISYGGGKSIVINSPGVKQIIAEITMKTD